MNLLIQTSLKEFSLLKNYLNTTKILNMLPFVEQSKKLSLKLLVHKLLVLRILQFKKKIIRLHMEEGRTYKSITAEYGVSKASVSKWCAEFSEECHKKADLHPGSPNEAELMKETLRLRKELEGVKKENLFLKNSGILCKGKCSYCRY